MRPTITLWCPVQIVTCLIVDIMNIVKSIVEVISGYHCASFIRRYFFTPQGAYAKPCDPLCRHEKRNSTQSYYSGQLWSWCSHKWASLPPLYGSIGHNSTHNLPGNHPSQHPLPPSNYSRWCYAPSLRWDESLSTCPLYSDLNSDLQPIGRPWSDWTASLILWQTQRSAREYW